MQQPRQIPKKLIDTFISNNYHSLLTYGGAILYKVQTRSPVSYDLNELLNQWYVHLTKMVTASPLGLVVSRTGFAFFIRNFVTEERRKHERQSALAKEIYEGVPEKMAPTQETEFIRTERIVYVERLVSQIRAPSVREAWHIIKNDLDYTDFKLSRAAWHERKKALMRALKGQSTKGYVTRAE